MGFGIYAVFFCSGASALIFETLWFRQAGLAFGNSVWASSLVLSGFMAGLALGNALAARYGSRLGNPLRAYAIAEAAIALTGVGLVQLLPAFGAALSPWLRPLLDQPSLLNPLRLSIAFVLLLIPSTAMGITLPLLARTLAGRDRHFGRVLGRLYGWNTLGAMAGVLVGEMYLVGAYGIRGTALVAGALNMLAAVVAGLLSMSGSDSDDASTHVPDSRYESSHHPNLTPEQSDHPSLTPGWLAAAFLSGFCLLALEVVWFRFLVLFVKGHSGAFPVMLGVVLAGIALGGLAASVWLRRAPEAYRFASTVAFLAGLACVISYAAFPRVLEPLALSSIVQPRAIVRLALPLMFPVSFLSGILFTVFGAALRDHLGSEAGTAGVLTLANTTGAALGSLAAGFILLPVLGMERSFFVIAAIYGGIGVLLWRPVKGRPTTASISVARPATAPITVGRPFRGRHLLTYACATTLLLSLVMFPFGSLEQRLLPIPVKRWGEANGETRLVAVREGRTETIIYFERLMAGQPVSSVMLTNSFSMSTTGYGVRRYQKLYVWWPMAVHPALKHALLIGYGVGNTAKAMTDSTTLETIDLVDLSRDILATSRVIYPIDAGSPLADPRLRVHIEDGRYFLQTTEQRFDLITGEPPPPGIAGVESLYTREYFQLLHDRLADGGMATYWLPLSDLSDVSAKAILAAFCDVFDDCSLWNGSGTNLMMVGTLGARGPVPEEEFTRQWNTPPVAAEMARLGVERPEQLGALFIGDATYVRALIGDSRALTDNYPRTIEAPVSSADEVTQLYASLTDTGAARTRFQSSPLIARLWPERLRVASVPYFDFQHVIDAHMYGQLVRQTLAVDDVHTVLTRSPLRTPILWRLASNSDIQDMLARWPDDALEPPGLLFHVAIRQLSERNYRAAALTFMRAEESPEVRDNAFALQIYALCMAGQRRQAQQLARDAFQSSGVAPDAPLPPFWVWMKETFGIDPRR